MAERLFTIMIMVAVSVVLAFSAGCESDAQTGALIGTAAGAGIGQLAGRDTESTLIGAAVGGGAGYIFGNEQDKKKARADVEKVREEMNTATVYITNSNGSVTSVKLKKSGQDYIGPRGEVYRNGLPTEEQLKQLYGM